MPARKALAPVLVRADSGQSNEARPDGLARTAATTVRMASKRALGGGRRAVATRRSWSVPQVEAGQIVAAPAGSASMIGQSETEPVDAHPVSDRAGVRSSSREDARRRGSVRIDIRVDSRLCPQEPAASPPKPISLVARRSDAAVCNGPRVPYRVTNFQPRSVRNRWSPLAISSRAVVERDTVCRLDRAPVGKHHGGLVATILAGRSRVVQCRRSRSPTRSSAIGLARPSACRTGVSAPSTKGTRMGATAVRIDRPAERHPRRLRHPVERRFRADFVEASVECLGCVEGPDGGRLAVARQGPALLGLDAQVVPAHTNTCSHTRRTGTAQSASLRRTP